MNMRNQIRQRSQRCSALRYALATLSMVLVLGICAAAAGDNVRIVVDKASIHLKPIEASAVLATVPVGAVLEMTGQEGDWLRVTLPADSSGFRREGYVNRRHAEMDGAAPAARAETREREPAPATSNARPEAAPRRNTSQRPTMAVLPFDDTGLQHWWYGRWDVGAGIADLIIDQLANSDAFTVLERKQLESVLVEQELAASDRADDSAAKVARIARLLGARYLLKGSVTQFAAETSSIGTNGHGPAILGGRLGLNTSTATVGLTVRLIDSSTAAIVASSTKVEQSQRRSVAMSGSTVRYGGGLAMTSANFRGTSLGDATQKAVESVIAVLVERMRTRRD